MTIIEICLIFYIAFGYTAIRCMYKKNNKTYTKVKIVACTFYLLIGLSCYIFTNNPIYFKMLPVYLAFYLGDICLAICHTDNGMIKSKPFLAGLGAFGLGHVLFALILLRFLDFNIKPYYFVIGVVYAIVVILNRKNNKFKFGKKYPLLAGYGIIIGTVANLGIALLCNQERSTSLVFLGIASICFLISDTIIAFKYFAVKKKKWYPAAELALYYVAMGLISTFTLLIS